MSEIHSLYRHSITVHTDDEPVMHCLRAIAFFAEHGPQKNIGFGGSGEDNWKRDDHQITLRFTHPEYRQVFRDVANDLLGGRWTQVDEHNNNPPPPK